MWYGLPQDNDRALKTILTVSEGEETTGPERTPATTCWSQVKFTHLVASVGTYSIHNKKGNRAAAPQSTGCALLQCFK